MVHDPNTMTLLCGSCHERVTRGFLSKEAVKRAKNKPAAKRRGFSHGVLDASSRSLTVSIGSIVAEETPNLISIDGNSVLSITAPTEDGEPYGISALFTDDHGSPVLAMKNNEWRILGGAQDAEAIGGKIYIRQKNFARVLVISLKEPEHIKIERAIISIDGHKIDINSENGVVFPGNNIFHGGKISRCSTAISFNTNRSELQKGNFEELQSSIMHP